MTKSRDARTAGPPRSLSEFDSINFISFAYFYPDRIIVANIVLLTIYLLEICIGKRIYTQSIYIFVSMQCICISSEIPAPQSKKK